MTVQEKEFKIEYDKLLAKYNVSLTIEKGVYEEGPGITPIFTEKSRYPKINYFPEYNFIDTGRHCMGG